MAEQQYGPPGFLSRTSQRTEEEQHSLSHHSVRAYSQASTCLGPAALAQGPNLGLLLRDHAWQQEGKISPEQVIRLSIEHGRVS